MTTSQRSFTALALAAAVSAFAPSAASAGPVANMWNSMFSPGYYAGYGPGYGTVYYPSSYSYTTSYAPTYAYGVSYSGYGYAGYSSCASCCGTSCCSPCCGSACSSCGSCGSCSSCAGGNCVASVPSTTPQPDTPPRTFQDPEGYDGSAGPESGTDESDGGFSPRDPDLGTERESLRPKTEDSAIPQKKAAPTPMPAVSNDPTVSPLDLDDEFVWTAAPERTRVKVHARFGSPTLARTRVAPEDAFETLPVATKLAAQK